MSVINREGNNVTDRLSAADQHAKPIETHAPAAVGLTSRPAQVEEPLDGTDVHPPLLYLGVELVGAPLPHGSAEQLADAGTEQIEREALAGPVVDLGHVEGLDLEGPVRHEDKGADLVAGGDVGLPLILGDGHVSKVLHQELLVLGPEVVLVSRQLLHLDPLHLAGVGVVGELGLVLHELSDDVDGVAVLDADEGPGEALLQEGAGGGEVGGGHPPLQKVKVLLASFVGVVDDELDEPLGLGHQAVHGLEGALVLDVEELGQMLVGVGLLGPEGLLARVHLLEAQDGGLEGELGRHGETDGQGVAVLVGREEVGRYGERFAGALAIADGHDVGIGQLDVLLVHEEMDGQAELGPDAEHRLHHLRPESVERQLAEAGHLLLRALLDGILLRIVDAADDADAGAVQLEVLRRRRRTQDDGAANDHGAAQAEMLGLLQLVKREGLEAPLVLRQGRGILGGVTGLRLGQLGLIDDAVQRPDPRAVVQVQEDDGAAAADADPPDPAVELGLPPVEEGPVPVVEAAQVDVRQGGQGAIRRSGGGVLLLYRFLYVRHFPRHEAARSTKQKKMAHKNGEPPTRVKD